MYQTRTESRTTTTTNTGSSSDSSTNARTRAREDVIICTMRDCLGVEPTPFLLQNASWWLRQFNDDERILMYALHQTAMAPRPSWRYTVAILTRCRNEGVTGDSLQLDDDLRGLGLIKSYTQRDYRNPDLPW